MLWQIHKETNLPIHIIRPFSGYGPGQSIDYPMTNLVNMVKNNPKKIQVWGSGQQTRDWVFVDDIVRTINWCVGDPIKYRTVNIGTGISTSFTQLLQIIYKIIYNTECPKIETLLDKPAGVPHRVADIQLQTRLGLLPSVDLVSGIKNLL
jgi:nucleoside-diphosphate-sugar epimerase